MKVHVNKKEHTVKLMNKRSEDEDRESLRSVKNYRDKAQQVVIIPIEK